MAMVISVLHRYIILLGFGLIFCSLCAAVEKPACLETDCKYEPDGPPNQMGPGKHSDDVYSFQYVSDYEKYSEMFRRKICNYTKGIKKVRFDWKIVRLSGKAPFGGVLAEETPYYPQPGVGSGPLVYDFKQTITNAYIFSSPSAAAINLRKLISLLSGYIEAPKEELFPVRISFASWHEEGRFIYEITNEGKNPAKIYWKEFTDLWSTRQREQYRSTLQSLIRENVIAFLDVNAFVLNPEKKSSWLFSSNQKARVVYSIVEIYAPRGEGADLSGVVPLYLPEK